MKHLRKVVLIVCILLFLGLCVFVDYLLTQKKALESRVTELEEALKNTTESLGHVQDEKNSLASTLQILADKNQNYADEIEKITNKVETLESLKKIDPELLQKYSKVYFLSENYTPSALTQIDTKYLNNKTNPLEIHDRVWPFLRDLLDAAASQGVDIKIASAYRSFGTQAQLKSSYRVTYGTGANAFSAEQGYSEHQLGTAIDFTTQATGRLDGFEKTNASTWLNANAYKYGFILSYPPSNKYYVYEPWHWRFVGLELAQRLHTENKNFYDLDQREISEYLAHIFSASITIQQ
jgi:LAS superfamily LD-carboxypeptidase LdcB